jgi:predicted GTPase
MSSSIQRCAAPCPGTDAVEKFSIIKALQAIDRAHVVVLMMDAGEGLTDQDMTLLSHVLERGRALVIALNKWDGLDQEHRKHIKSEMDRRLTYISWAKRDPRRCMALASRNCWMQFCRPGAAPTSSSQRLS